MPKRYFALPDTFYRLLSERREAVLLESSQPSAAEYSSLLFTDPVEVLELKKDEPVKPYLSALAERLKGGFYLAGYSSYEAGYELVGVADEPALPYPRAWFGVYREPITFDHLTGKTSDPEHKLAEVDALSERDVTIENLRLDLSHSDYLAKVARIRAYLEAGDSYQVNFTAAYRFDMQGEVLDLYRRLKRVQAVPFGAYLKTAPLEAACLSPELFFRLKGGRLSARPMKGTAPRGRTTAEDEQLIRELRADEKTRAENLMIVDLLRNDLGRVSRSGTVAVPELFEVERYRSLLQMTSTVTGTLQDGLDVAEVLAALFPCGSVTGAPKRRTMEIIRELESRPRGLYTGSIGYLTPSGDAAFNVAIRTVCVQQGRAVMGVGGGIVYDSTPEAEYAEVQLKADFLKRETEAFALFETMRWDRGYRFAEQHLDRLEDSAGYFGFAFDRDAAMSLLERERRRFTPGVRYRVKLSLAETGAFEVKARPFETETEGSLKVALAETRVDSSNPFLYHKTTLRGLYDAAGREAEARGLADVIFLNERGEVSEGAISNIFIARAGALLTPPLTSGLLPGIYRARLLAHEPKAREQTLYPEDLAEAEGVYLCNALRGLRRVEFEKFRTSLS